MSSVLYEFRDGVARITLNRPDKLNSFSAGMHGVLRPAIDRSRADGARALSPLGQQVGQRAPRSRKEHGNPQGLGHT